MTTLDSPAAPKPVNRGVVTLVSYLGLFLFAFTVPLATPVKKQIASTLGLPDQDATGPFFREYFLAWLFIIPLGSYLAERFGRKALLMVGSAMLTAGMLTVSAATTFEIARVGQFLNGGGAILLQVIGIAVVTDLFAHKRGSSLSVAVGIVGIIALLSPILMGEMISRGVSWQSVYRYSAILPFTALVLQAISVFPPNEAKNLITLKIVGELLKSPLFILLILSMLVYASVEQGIPTWAGSFLEVERGASERTAGYVVSAYFIIMSLARLLVGAIGGLDRFSFPAVIVISAILGVACIALGTLPQNSSMGVIFFAISGAAIAMIWPSIMTFAVETTQKPTAVVFGLVVGIGGSIGAAFGADVLGKLKQNGLSYQQALLTLLIPLIILIVVFGIFQFNRKKPAPAAGE